MSEDRSKVRDFVELGLERLTHQYISIINSVGSGDSNRWRSLPEVIAIDEISYESKNLITTTEQIYDLLENQSN